MDINTEDKKQKTDKSCIYIFRHSGEKESNDLIWLLSTKGYRICSPMLRGKAGKITIYRIIRKLCVLLRIYHPLLFCLFRNINYERLKEARAIIMFDNAIDRLLCHILSVYFPNKRLIVWFWNSIDAKYCSLVKKMLNGTRFEMWSFDLINAKNYTMEYNKTFCVAASLVNKTQIISISKTMGDDVFFLGQDKGRMKKILSIKKIFDRLGISSDIRIVKSIESIDDDYSYSPSIPYIEVLDIIQNVKALLDVPMNGQTGSTQREMEALWFNKKLLTTNKDIVNRDFYHKDNIYIIDTNKPMDDIRDFLESPYVPIDDKIIRSYTIDEWLKRFNI